MNIKKTIGILIIMLITISCLITVNSKAVTQPADGVTLVGYTDVAYKSQAGETLKIIINNQKDVKVDKIYLKDASGNIVAQQTDIINTGKNYIEYNKKVAGVYQLWLFKQGKDTPFVKRNVEILYNSNKNTHSTNFSPSITYNDTTNADNIKFKINDGNGIDEIIVQRKNDKGTYENAYTANKANNYKDSNGNANITSLTVPKKEGTSYVSYITIKKILHEDSLYLIKAKDSRGVVHTREVKVVKKASKPGDNEVNVSNGIEKNNYTGVSLKTEKIDNGNKLKITIKNQGTVKVDKMVMKKGNSAIITQDKILTTNKNYIEFDKAETGVYQIEFYKKDATSPFMTKNLNIFYNINYEKYSTTRKTSYSTNYAPGIGYEDTKGQKVTKFKILDGNQTSPTKPASSSYVTDLEIQKKNASGKYEQIYKLSGDKETKTNSTISITKNLDTRNITINIQKLEDYAYYKIIAKDNYGLIQEREVKVQCLKQPSSTVAKTEFKAGIKVTKTDTQNLIFQITNTDAKNVKKAEILKKTNNTFKDNVLAQSQITKNSKGNVEKITFNKEGIYRLRLTDDKGKVFEADYLINKKFDSQTWGVNGTPTIRKAGDATIIGDKNISTIKITTGDNDNISVYEYNSSTNKTSHNSNYAVPEKNPSDVKDGEYKITFKRQSTAKKYKIIAKDKTGFSRVRVITISKK